MMKPSLETLMWGLAFSTTFELVYWASLWLFKRKEQTKELKEVLFFPDEKIVSKMGPGSGPSDGEPDEAEPVVSGFSRLVEILRDARRTLDISLFCFTSRHLREVVEEKQRQGVLVRVVADKSTAAEGDSQIHRLRAAGIEVRENNGNFFMHHKFAVIDRKVLINGSFNWSNHAITGNNENVMLVSDKTLVEPYVKQFEMLWEQFDPKKTHPLTPQ